MLNAHLLALGVRVRLEAPSLPQLEALLDRVPAGWALPTVDVDAADELWSPLPLGEKARVRGPARHDCRLSWVGSLDASNPRPPQRLLLNDQPVVTARRPQDLLDRFEHELQAAVAARTQRVVLHAGVVTYRDRAILLPGRSFCGKSTLVYALTDAGATYYSDDLAALDDHGQIHAVPKRLALRRGLRPGSTIPARTLGWHGRCRPCDPGLIVFCRYRPEATFASRQLTPGEGTLALFRHTVSAEAAPERAFRALARLAERTPILRTDRGEASTAAEAILARLEAER